MDKKWIYGISEGERIAIRHDGDVTLTIGGYTRNRIFIEEIIENFFQRAIPSPKKPQKNKVRYELKYDWSDYRKVITEIIDSGLSVVQTKNHARIMS